MEPFHLVYLRLRLRFAWDSGKCGSLVASAFDPVQPRVSFSATTGTGRPCGPWLRCRPRLVGAVATAAASHYLHPKRVKETTTRMSLVRTGAFPQT